MVISCFRLFQLEPERVLLRMPEPISAPALANLQKFSVFSKTTLSQVDSNWCGLGLVGPQAAEQLQQAGIQPPEPLGGQYCEQDLICVRVAGQQPRFELWVSPARAQSLWRQLAENSQSAPPANWQAAEIEAGLAQLSADSIESYIPQMLNLQAVDAISFDKGCYTGQEVVARLQYRGKLKKLLVSATLANETAAPVQGATIVNANGRSIGKVLSVVRYEDHWLIQIVISKVGFDEGGCQLDSPEGPRITLQPLPYSLEPELFERPEPKL
jgi:folate-binding protein YgfZ